MYHSRYYNCILKSATGFDPCKSWVSRLCNSKAIWLVNNDKLIRRTKYEHKQLCVICFVASETTFISVIYIQSWSRVSVCYNWSWFGIEKFQFSRGYAAPRRCSVHRTSILIPQASCYTPSKGPGWVINEAPSQLVVQLCWKIEHWLFALFSFNKGELKRKLVLSSKFIMVDF